ncbi:hypothetical protein BC829DRAFT_424213 [Chytridium lagenaria]|nr:hypothetical protein BC829DRAFT_424213 [Chytridium lagenaria]
MEVEEEEPGPSTRVKKGKRQRLIRVPEEEEEEEVDELPQMRRGWLWLLDGILYAFLVTRVMGLPPSAVGSVRNIAPSVRILINAFQEESDLILPSLALIGTNQKDKMLEHFFIIAESLFIDVCNRLNAVNREIQAMRLPTIAINLVGGSIVNLMQEWDKCGLGKSTIVAYSGKKKRLEWRTTKKFKVDAEVLRFIPDVYDRDRGIGPACWIRKQSTTQCPNGLHPRMYTLEPKDETDRWILHSIKKLQKGYGPLAVGESEAQPCPFLTPLSRYCVGICILISLFLHVSVNAMKLD